MLLSKLRVVILFNANLKKYEVSVCWEKRLHFFEFACLYL